MVALPPDIVEQHIEDGHGHRGNQLADAQDSGVVFQAGGAESHGPGNQMERVTGTQHDCHDAEQPELRIALASADHADTEGDDGGEIDNVKQSFCNSLHNGFSFLL